MSLTCSSLNEARQYAYQRLHESPRAWIALYHARNTRGERLSFDRRPWAKSLYLDESSDIVIVKASQIGITDWALCDMLASLYSGRDVMYVLPYDKQVIGFTPRRIDAMIRRSEFLKNNSWTHRKDSDFKGQKTLFGHNAYIVGSQNSSRSKTEKPTNFFEKPVDVVIIDEFDLCDQQNLVYVLDRTGASANPKYRKLGNPTYKGKGISSEFNLTDRKYWYVRCVHCNEWQPFDWFVNVVRLEDDGTYQLLDSRLDSSSADGDGRQDAQVFCRRCHNSIDRLSPGEWVAEDRSAIKSGYQINKIFADARKIPVIARTYQEFLEAQGNPTKLQRFYNNVLGIPYSAPGTRITDEVLASCVREKYRMPNKATDCVAGCDVGKVLHLHISAIESNKRVKVFIGTCNTFEEVARICAQYGVTRGVMDSKPEMHKSREFVSENPGWFLCDYNKDERIKDEFVVDYKESTVAVNRTESMDASMAEWVSQFVVIPDDYRTVDNGEFVKQMEAPVRKFDELRGKYVWDEEGSPDHHRHADNYERIGFRMYRSGADLLWV